MLVPLAAVPLLLLLAYGFRTDPRSIPSPLLQKPAPSFRLEILGGGETASQALRGKPTILNFWASWCFPACYEEAPLLEATWRKYKDRGLVMLGVAIQDKEPNALEFMKRFGFSFPNGMDPGGKISIDFGVYGVPETFFIDRQGQIVYKHVGALEPQLLEERILALLAEK